ncbi:ribbon-helix-helix domain-containing protein [Argonema galeatum]|uniref:ribbon-helix-helix domain-containing protein n=1 Tax=Argonema galeatum TaxID=2942762 RepID=UPI0020128548|nr:CopG family transcriptional regulator [Argonema galeatum]MCL1463822.1 CopG family transcriptional regulator [Argonema galeatum A003/A1]
MPIENLSISLPVYLVDFIEKYKTSHQYQSPSQVIEAALKLLQNWELEEAYRQASEEIDSDWDITIGDGLTDETW